MCVMFLLFVHSAYGLPVRWPPPPLAVCLGRTITVAALSTAATTSAVIITMITFRYVSVRHVMIHLPYWKSQIDKYNYQPIRISNWAAGEKKKIVVRCLWHQSRWLLNISIYNYLKRRIITASVKCFAVRDGHWTQLEPYWNSNAVTRRYCLNNSQRRDIGRYDVGKQWSAKGYWTLRNAVVFA